MDRTKNETFLEYCIRLTQGLKNREISYKEWAKGVIGDTDYGDDYLRRASNVFSLFLDKLLAEGVNNIDDKIVLSEIERQKKELLKERKKLQTENLEYQSHLRNEARGEMFNEKILEAIELLPKFNLSPFKRENTKNTTIGVLCIADAHYGSVIELKSIFGEVVNEYNTDVFKARLRLLAAKVIADYQRMNYGELVVFDLGDMIENILRTSSLQKLQLGMIDATLEYAEIMANWLVELHNALGIKITYSAVGGNHDIARILSSKKDFPEENLAKVVVKFLQLRFAETDYIEISDYADCQFDNICGENILVYHGDNAKSESEEMAFWENYHDIQIDLLIMAHKHSKSEKGVGYGAYGDKEVIHVPSFVGADTYSKSLRKISRAGAKFMLFENGEGRTLERTYFLN